MPNNQSTKSTELENAREAVVEEGKSVEEATAKALEKLNTSKDSVDVEILEEPGLLAGLFGKKSKVRVTRKGSLGERAADVTRKIMELMEIRATVNLHEASEGYQVEIRSDSDGLLIGRRGETLAALQHVVWRILGKSSSAGQEPVEHVTLDVSGYKKRRERQIKDMAVRWAKKVETSGQRFTSESMSAAERRIVHLALKDKRSIRTFSVGRGQERRVVVAPAEEVENARGRP